MKTKYFSYISIIFIFACNTNNKHIIAKFPQDLDLERQARAGNISKNQDGFILFSTDRKNYNLIFKISLQTISKLFPILASDEKNGLIISDWAKIYNISKNNNLYKINVIINENKNLRNTIEVVVFRKDFKSNNVKEKEIAQQIQDIIINSIEVRNEKE